MRVVALVPRYHDAIVGGSEEYLRQLFRGLHHAGVDLRVFTTQDTQFHPAGPYGLRWGNSLTGQPALAADPFTVRRFRTVNVPAGLSRRWSRAIARAQERGRAVPLHAGLGYLDTGFFALERWAGDFEFRWTGAVARFDVRGQGVSGVRLEVMSLRDTRLAIAVDDAPAAEVGLSAHEWTVVDAPFTARERARVRLSVRDTFEPDGDPRALGVAVRSVTVTSEAGTQPLPLARDREGLLSSLPTDELAEQLDREGMAAGAHPAVLEGLLKGPVSPSLVAAATRAARRADLVLATNAPFVTMAQGLLVGRLARRPVVLLPFLHLRDAAHHRWTLRHVLSRADRVLCLSHSSCRLMERLWATRARFLGGGVHPEEFTGREIDPRAFREAHGLGASPLVVTVARKTPSKGYRLTCDAVRTLRERGVPCEHVLVGPDEDGLPVDPAGGRAIGARPRAEVLSALAAADVFSLPSVYESFGLAYLEAWMMGKPVIGHRLCDPAAELIDEGRDGLLVTDVGSTVSALEALLADPARRAAFGTHGRRKTLERFTWPHVVARALDVFAELHPPPQRSS
jgi:glycosyltransferase involved in cell wall biosynthesis